MWCGAYTRLLLVLPVIAALCSSRVPVTGQTPEEEERAYRPCSADTDCPLWAACHNSTCTCGENLEKFDVVTCNKETLQLSVIRCHCVTFDPQTNELIEGTCLETCENNKYKFGHVFLPINISELNRVVCEEKWNRTGRLCGKCLPGHSPLAYSYDIRCVKCPEGNRNVWKYILIAFGPLTIFYFLVLFLKINVTSSHLHGYVIFSQILGTPVFARNVVIYSLGHPDRAAYIQALGVVYTISNLDFFRMLNLGICLDVSNLTLLALDYAVAIYPLLLTVLSYFLIELHARNFRVVVTLWKPFHCFFIHLRRNWDSKTSVIDAYATFFTLSYIKIMYVSADLLIPVRVQALNNDSAGWALYYDATVDYFGGEHLPYAILAVVCLVLVMIPTMVLFLYQLSWFQKILVCLKIQSQILRALMDSFQRCYKDGTEPGTRDYRWFAAVPLAGRAFLLLIYAFTYDGSFLPLLVIICVCIILFTVNVQPYKNHSLKYAKSDITFWGLLVIFFSFDDAIAFPSLRPAVYVRVVSVFQVIAAIFPLLYVICITAYYVLSGIKSVKKLVSRLKAWRRGYLNLEMDFDEYLPDRVANPEHYNPLQESVHYNSASQSNDTY